MEFMKKFVALGLLSAVLSSSLLAEGNGVYIGTNYQLGQARLNSNIYNTGDCTGSVVGCPPGLTANKHNPGGTNINWHSKYANGALNGFGLNVGYKKFFQFKSLDMTSKWFGFRVYGLFDYGHADLGKQVYAPNKIQLDMVSWGVGSDLLADIIDKDNASFGIFGGVAIGGNTWKSSAANYWKEQIIQAKGPDVCTPTYCNPNAPYSTQTSTVAFQVWLNFGVRANIYKHNGVEFGVRVPLLINKFLSAGPNATNLYYHLKRDYSLYLGYNYTF
ncbi:Hop family outer membrane protein HopE [Helicobacter pylori]|uniref:Hop family outer membrane protein HopE n=1 Tax=Helicobacter pylori TaxID=210 RepID=UPI001FD245AB|nr:Hop family outer membrane protein HopE [Helicobacter pylori]UOR89683.1 Hop family outer membrane protein HopE [Helicobacter pylori]